MRPQVFRGQALENKKPAPPFGDAGFSNYVAGLPRSVLVIGASFAALTTGAAALGWRFGSLAAFTALATATTSGHAGSETENGRSGAEEEDFLENFHGFYCSNDTSSAKSRIHTFYIFFKSSRRTL